jgi:hypothetical protein
MSDKVQIKINRAHPMGVQKSHEGKTFTAERVGKGYRLERPFSHYVIHDDWISRGHAELVEPCMYQF